MNAILRSTLAVAGLAIASPALAWTVWPDVDFEWYANVGRPGVAVETFPAPRAGYIWSPARYEWTGTRQVAMPGVWIKDDYDQQWRTYSMGQATVYTTGPVELRDRDGKVIPITPDAYPVGSAR